MYNTELIPGVMSDFSFGLIHVLGRLSPTSNSQSPRNCEMAIKQKVLLLGATGETGTSILKGLQESGNFVSFNDCLAQVRGTDLLSLPFIGY